MGCERPKLARVEIRRLVPLGRNSSRIHLADDNIIVIFFTLILCAGARRQERSEKFHSALRGRWTILFYRRSAATL